MSSTCEGVASNSDIAGIGVRTCIRSHSLNKVNFITQIRINLYVTAVLRTIIPTEPENREILSCLDINTAVACLGLLVTAFTQTVLATTFRCPLRLSHPLLPWGQCISSD